MNFNHAKRLKKIYTSRNYNSSVNSGRIGSRIRIAWEYWSRVKRTFINGSHSTVGALSWNEDVTDRNNQSTLSVNNSHS